MLWNLAKNPPTEVTNGLIDFGKLRSCCAQQRATNRIDWCLTVGKRMNYIQHCTVQSSHPSSAGGINKESWPLCTLKLWRAIMFQSDRGSFNLTLGRFWWWMLQRTETPGKVVGACRVLGTMPRASHTEFRVTEGHWNHHVWMGIRGQKWLKYARQVPWSPCGPEEFRNTVLPLPEFRVLFQIQG